jgi:hypothetical protein
VDDEHVLVRVGLFLPAIVQPLFFGVFRPLASPLCAINDETLRLRVATLSSRNLPAFPFRHHAQDRKRVPQDRQQAMNPLIRPRLTQAQ